MIDSTTSTIVPSVFDWHETEIERLKVGSRFRFIDNGTNPIADELFVVLHVFGNQSIQVFATEWIDNKTIETSYRELSLKDCDSVLVTAFHEQSIANGVK